jgi:methionyl-tRNA formyltransferase
MRIILIGQGPFGEKVLEALLNKKGSVVASFSPADKRGDAMHVLAEKSGIPSFRPGMMKDPSVYDAFVKLQPDIVALAFVTDIIPGRLLNVPSQGSICYHPSLLPRHRGASAINWALIQGDERTGLTVFWVDKGIDTGPILLQKEVEIGPDDTTGSLYFNFLFPMGVDAMIEAVELIKQGKAPRIIQDESKATYEPPCDDRVASVAFEKPVTVIYNLIRGCDPQPGAFTMYKGNKVRLYDAKMSPTVTNKHPGEVVRIEEGSVHIAAQGGVITVGKFRVNRGEKIVPLEFVNTVGMKIGERFSSSS